MAAERLYTVDGATAVPATPVSLAQAGLKERSDLQEWVIAHPEILGPDVLVIASEFDRWRTSAGARQLDRLDVLGLDSEGRLVVAELKRDRAPDTVEMQAVKYAAMASRFTEQRVVDAYLRMRRAQGATLDEEVARQAIVAHAGELDPEQLRRPRIVLVAGSFPPVVTATAVWLTEMGLDLTLQRVQAYRVFDERIVVTVSQVFPIADVEDFTITPQQAEAKAAEEKRKGRRELSTVLRLVADETLPDGTDLVLRPTTEVTSDVREQITAWVEEDPRRGRAVWHNDRAKPLQWAYDGGRYRPTEIVRRVLGEAAGLERSVRGPSWWVDADGSDLPTLAGVPERGTFDWTQLHQVLASVPQGRWTTYGDLAGVIGTAAQPLGQHITSCAVCPDAHRVLGGDGRAREGFRWADPERRDSQREALEAEGVRFQGDRADPSLRFTEQDLEQFAGEAS